MPNEKLRVGIAGLAEWVGITVGECKNKKIILTTNRQTPCCELFYHVPGDCGGSQYAR